MVVPCDSDLGGPFGAIFVREYFERADILGEDSRSKGGEECESRKSAHICSWTVTDMDRCVSLYSWSWVCGIQFPVQLYNGSDACIYTYFIG